MSKYRPLNAGDVLPASFIAALQEYISTHAANLLIEPSGTPPTSITAQASAGAGQVALGINGLWRYTSTTVVAAHPGGAAGTYDILAVASANSFGAPDTDATDYAFGLQIVPAGGSSSGTLNGNAIVAERKVGTVLWDGSQISAITQTVGSQSSSRTQFTISPNPAITPQRIRGAASQAAPLAVWETSTGSQRAAVGADGVFAALGYQVGGTPLAASHLSNGVTGAGAGALASSPALSGTPAAPTAPVDTNTTQLASTAFVLGQLAAAGDGTPAMNGAASRGASLHGARADHVHPTDTSRAALAGPTFTGAPAAPTAAVDTNTTQIATTAFVLAQLAGAGDGTPAMDGAAARGTSTHGARADHVHPIDTSRAPLASPGLTGTPTAPTAAVDTNTAQIATTAFVSGQLSASGDGTPMMDGPAARGTSVHGARADHVHPVDTSRAPVVAPVFSGNIQFGGGGSGGHLNSFTPAYALFRSNYWAPTDRLVDTTRPAWSLELDGRSGFDTFRVLRAPASTVAPVDTQLLSLTSAGLLTVGSVAATTFTGTPSFSGAATGQTAVSGDNSAKLATTSFVQTAVAARTVPSSSPTIPLMDGVAALGTEFMTYARGDHVHPTDTSRAPIASPSFTGTVTIGGGPTLVNNAGILQVPNLNASGQLRTFANAHIEGGQVFFNPNDDTYLQRQAVGVIRANGMLAAGGIGTPTSGTHVEISHDGTTGIVESYGRPGGSKALWMIGSELRLRSPSLSPSSIQDAIRITGGGIGFFGNSPVYRRDGGLSFDLNSGVYSHSLPTSATFDSGGFPSPPTVGDLANVVRTIIRELHLYGLLSAINVA
jgi:hypothetical protein